MTTEVLGRERELGALEAFLGHPLDGFAGLVIEGEAGIGKSTLLAAAVAAARQRTFQVLVSRPAEAERDLAYVVLGDLFEEVLGEVLPLLTPARRHAIEAALLVGQVPEQATDPRALAVAVRTTLQVLAERGPLVLAVDDEQWMDAASANALRFALRRLRDEPVLLLLARRPPGKSGTFGLEGAIESGPVERLALGPLSVGALHRLVQQRLGWALTRPTLLRVVELAGGNPFYVLELARGLGPGGAVASPTEPIPVPESLERLVSTRLERIADPTRAALLLVAAHGRPSTALLHACGMTERDLEPAVVAQVVERAGGLVRFTHPLLASALYQRALPEERRAAHGRLAGLVDDPVERGRHLALGTGRPDGEAAAAVDEAARVAIARGATLAAAELREHALRLTPADELENRHRRALAAARAQLTAGDAIRARALALQLLGATPGGPRRVESLVLLSDIESNASIERAIELRREALVAAADLPRVRAELELWLGERLRVTEGVRSAERHVRVALELADQLDDAGIRTEALAVLAGHRFRASDPDAVELASQAAHLAASAVDPEVRMRAGLQVVNPLVWSFELARARALLETMLGEWRDRDEATSARVLWYLGMVELRAGQLSLASEHAERSREITRQYAIDDREPPLDLWLVALIAAHRGDLDRARALAERSRVLAEGQPLIRAGQEGVLGLVALWGGDPRAAAAHFAEADAARRGSGVNEPAMFWWRADYVEALLALGRVEEAAALVDAWEADGVRLGRTVVVAHAQRCRGLIAAAGGDIAGALAHLEAAVRHHAEVGDEIGRARTLLALGIVRRRARQKRAARQAIQSALAAFEAAGASSWANRARAELGRIGGRTRIEGLTPAELRVATLVARGRTNREVAAVLFVGERTVETHLSHVYAKLGVRSRAELARAFRADGQSSGEVAISS